MTESTSPSSFQTPVEIRVKGQTLQAAWQSQLIQSRIETRVEVPTLHAAWQSQLLQAPNTGCDTRQRSSSAGRLAESVSPISLRLASTVKLCRPHGRVNFPKHWLRLASKVKLCRPHGRVNFSKHGMKVASTVELCRPHGRVTSPSSNLLLRLASKVQLCRPLAEFTSPTAG